jgi:competence protein ComEC
MRNLLFWVFLLTLAIVRLVSQKPDFSDGKIVQITGVITTEPVTYTYYQRVSLAGLKIFLPKYPEVSYGDKITVTGKVEKGELTGAKLNVIEEKVLPLSSLRQKIITFYQKSLPEPHASLLSGIVMGSKKGLPQEFWRQIVKTGVAHVVVASGMNVTMVSGFILNLLLLYFPRRKAIYLALVGVWSYVALSGIDAPLVRAAIMGSIIFFGQFLGRVASTIRVLVITGLIMIIIFPRWLLDIGFILSFIATFSLILFQAKIERFFSFLPGILRGGLTTSLAAQIGVAPVIMVSFGNFSLLSPLVNALVLWTVAPITIIGMLAGGVGFIIPELGKACLYLAYPLTAWFVEVVRIFSLL